MPEWRSWTPGTCCPEPEYERRRVADEGERLYQYTICRSCGARFRDKYRYVGTAVDPTTLRLDAEKTVVVVTTADSETVGEVIEADHEAGVYEVRITHTENPTLAVGSVRTYREGELQVEPIERCD